MKEIYATNSYSIKDLVKSDSTSLRNYTAFYNNEIISDTTSIFDLDLSGNNKLELYSRYNLMEDYKKVKIPLYFESGDSIENVKAFYSEKTGIPSEKMVFMYNDKELANEKLVADYNIQKEQVINVFVKLNVTPKVEEGKGEVVSSNEYAFSGDKIQFTLRPDEGYVLDKVLVNGKNKINLVKDNKLELECSTEDISVKVSYK